MPLRRDTGDCMALTGADGRLLARMRSERLGNGYEIDPAPGVPPGEVAAAIAAELPGWDLAPDPDLAEALRALGGRLGRHAHLHSRDLRADPPPPEWGAAPPPEGTEFAPVRGADPDLAESMDAAYPAGHPDRADHDGAGVVAEIVAGRVLGQLLPCSRVLLAADGRACAGALVTGRDGEAPWGGPWLTVLFRHPERAPRGAGRILLARSLAQAAADGLPSVSLVVTDGNPARRIYDALGLRRVRSTVNVALRA